MGIPYFFRDGRVILAAIVGIAISGIAFFLSDLPLLWVVLILLVVPLGSMIFFSGNVRIAAFYLFVFILPIAFQKVIFTPDKEALMPQPVLVISLCDIPMFLFIATTFFEAFKMKVRLRNDVVFMIISFFALLLWSLLALPKMIELHFGVLSFVIMFFYLLKAYILLICLLLVPLKATELKVVFNLFVFGALIQGCIVLFQHFTKSHFGIVGVTPTNLDFSVGEAGRYFRASGTFGHANLEGQYFAFVIPLIFALFLASRQRLTTFFTGAAFFLTCLALILTFSRGSWLATSIALICCTILTVKRAMTKDKFLKISLIIFSVLVLFLILLNPIIDRLSIGDEGATGSRIRIMKASLLIIADNPLIGTGLNSFQEITPKYNVREGAVGFYKNGVLYTIQNNPVHNRYLLTAAETGIIGFIFFLTFLLTVLTSGFKYVTRYRSGNVPIAFGIFSAFVGILFYMQVEIFNDSIILVLLMLMIGLLFNCRHLDDILPPEASHV